MKTIFRIFAAVVLEAVVIALIVSAAPLVIAAAVGLVSVLLLVVIAGIVNGATKTFAANRHPTQPDEV